MMETLNQFETLSKMISHISAQVRNMPSMKMENGKIDVGYRTQMRELRGALDDVEQRMSTLAREE